MTNVVTHSFNTTNTNKSREKLRQSGLYPLKENNVFPIITKTTINTYLNTADYKISDTKISLALANELGYAEYPTLPSFLFSAFCSWHCDRLTGICASHGHCRISRSSSLCFAVMIATPAHNSSVFFGYKVVVLHSHLQTGPVGVATTSINDSIEWHAYIISRRFSQFLPLSCIFFYVHAWCYPKCSIKSFTSGIEHASVKK